MMRSFLLSAALAVSIAGNSNIAAAQGEGPPVPWGGDWPPSVAPGTVSPPWNQGTMPIQPTAAVPARTVQGASPMMGATQSGMTIPSRGNPERDFATGMILHLESAVSMAKMASQDTRDPEVRRLAQGIIKAQEHEIGHLRAILRRLGEG